MAGKKPDRPAEHGAWRVYASRRMAVLLGLGFSSGLPLLLTSATLTAWLVDAGYDLTTVGVLGLVTLPYSLKFLWAPVMDGVTWPLLGRRRGWLLATQAATGLAIAALGLWGPGTATLPLLATVTLLAAFCAASQDIVADAYRTDVLEPAERGAGAAVFVTGYRAGMILGGAVALVLADRVPWPAVYGVMAAAMLIGVTATLAAEEPADGGAARTSWAQVVVEPFAAFFGRFGVGGGLLVLAFILLFRLPDEAVKPMATALLKSHYTNAEIGVVQQGFGLTMTIVGALLGGAAVARLGLRRCLLLFAVLQAVSNLGYAWLASVGAGPRVAVLRWTFDPRLAGVVTVENFCGGLVTAGFVAFLMGCCDRRYSAAQYALLSSLMAMGGILARGPTGAAVEAMGYAWFFVATVAAGLPAILLLPWVRREGMMDEG